MKEIVLEPILADETVIVQFTANVTVGKNVVVKAPNGFSAIVFIDEKIAFRMNAGVGKKLVDYGKEYLNNSVKSRLSGRSDCPK